MNRKLILALASAAALVSLPAVAHADHRYPDWGGQASLFDRDFRHIRDGIRHGVRDGSFSRREAWQFRQELDRIRQRLDFYQYNDGYLNRWEVRDIRRRFSRLHEYMHDAHEDGHAERDYRFGDYDRSFSGQYQRR